MTLEKKETAEELLDDWAKTFHQQWGKLKPYRSWKELKETNERLSIGLPTVESFASFCSKKLELARVEEREVIVHENRRKN